MQLESLEPHVELPMELKDGIIPYLSESGIDISSLNSDRRLVIQDLMVYQVIDKRKRELDDIAKGEHLAVCNSPIV